jgi:pimeloyl-ACP methyl ester carboxylesterase
MFARWAVVLLASVVLAPVATASTASGAATTSFAASVGVPPAAPLRWSACAGSLAGLQCATLAVPLDYADLAGPWIHLAVARHPASDPAERIGSLFINPGGPGASGIADLPEELDVLTPELIDRFDIVEWDPRGVGQSDPVRCIASSSGSSDENVDPVPTTAEQEDQLIAADREFAAGCERGSGRLLDFVGTASSARDLDMLREAVGDTRLTYLGHSYGTYLGAIYAELFPARVRAMVLDGAIDPSLSIEQMALAQDKAMVSALNLFISWCEGSRACYWRPAGNPTAALVAEAERSGSDVVYNGVLDAMYATSRWPSLGAALAEAQGGDVNGLVRLGTSYSTGGGGTSGDANEAIQCVDHPVPRDLALFPAYAARAASIAPFFGPYFAWGALGCAVWPAPPTLSPHPVSDLGAPPVLVTGATGDPATPYAWAVSLARQMHGVLLTWDGVDHVAYYYSACVRAIDQSYLVEGALPAAGTVCTD